ncbi:hypothetical protein [Botrimarina sp.]|uniref:hypothetical protein n=1 Tax=Botrimarina sp. TaxID=2795802 RepID=UPI0032EE0F6A
MARPRDRRPRASTRRPAAALAAWVLSGWGSPLLACPYCDSRIGKQVAAGIFNEAFGYNLLLTLAPVPLLVGTIAVLHFGPPDARRAARRVRSLLANANRSRRG